MASRWQLRHPEAIEARLLLSGRHLNPGIIRGLSPRNAGYDAKTCQGNNGRANGNPVDAAPAVAHPDHARQDLVSHMGAGLELAALVGYHNGSAGDDTPPFGILRMHPELRPVAVSRGQRRQRPTLVKKGMK